MTDNGRRARRLQSVSLCDEGECDKAALFEVLTIKGWSPKCGRHAYWFRQQPRSIYPIRRLPTAVAQ